MNHRHIDSLLRQAVILAALAVLLLPAARGQSHWLGWTPLWLLGMPLVAWWALHRFRLPTPPRALRRRRRGPQARRRKSLGQRQWLRAA